MTAFNTLLAEFRAIVLTIDLDPPYLDSCSESEEDLVLDDYDEPAPTQCDWGVCDDLLYAIGRQVLAVRWQRAGDKDRSRQHNWRVMDEFKEKMGAMRPTKKYPRIEVPRPSWARGGTYYYNAPRMGGDILKGMKLKYVLKNAHTMKVVYTWRDSLAERQRKIDNDNQMRRER